MGFIVHLFVDKKGVLIFFKAGHKRSKEFLLYVMRKWRHMVSLLSMVLSYCEGFCQDYSLLQAV